MVKYYIGIDGAEQNQRFLSQMAEKDLHAFVVSGF